MILGGLTAASCYTATVDMTMAVGEGKTQQAGVGHRPSWSF